MPKSSRLRRGDPFWRDTIAAWKDSGLSLTAFCAERGIAQSTFFAKRRALDHAGRVPSKPVAATPNPSFATVRVIPDPTVEIVLPVGVILRVPLAADAQQLAKLVLALGATPC